MEKYELNWIGKNYAKSLANNISNYHLVEDVEHNTKLENKDSGNILICGDNLEALKALSNEYKNKVNVIYIDPPYNTRKKFIYNDNFTYTDNELQAIFNCSLADLKNIKKKYSKEETSHSAWLTFMYSRLYLARELLKDDGVIFISIDENEFAQLKLLCDSIFGENNFVGTMIWRKKSGGGQTDEFFVTEHEYIFGYRKSSQFIWNDKHEKIDQNEYKYTYSDGSLYKIIKLEKWGSSSHKEDRPTMYFPIKDPDGNDLYPIAPDKKDGRWRVGKERLYNLVKNKHIHWIKDKKENRWVPYEMSFYNENQIKILKSRSILYDLAETGTATKLLTKIFNEKDIFSNPKPIELIKYLLEHTKSETVLDFFAGSGTTGHAVMQLNAEDGGNRKFICVQSPEKTNEKSYALKAGFKNVFDITKTRIEKSADKISKDFHETKVDLGFKIYTLTSIQDEQNDKN